MQWHTLHNHARSHPIIVISKHFASALAFVHTSRYLLHETCFLHLQPAAAAWPGLQLYIQHGLPAPLVACWCQSCCLLICCR